MGGNVATEVLPVDSLDVGSWSQDGPPERRLLVGYGVEMIKYHFLHLLLHFLEGERERERERERFGGTERG